MTRSGMLFLILMPLLAGMVDTAVVSAQKGDISAVEFHVVPESRRLRPYDTALLQLRVYGRGKSGETGRLRRGGADFGIREKKGGWLSKPFRYRDQGEDEFVGRNRLLSTLRGIVIRDSILYTAPAESGRYTIEASLEGHTASVTIQVDPRAPSRRPAEKTSFPAERPSGEPYRELAAHYAPFIAQATWFKPKADYLARFDYDGDWRGDNNWDSMEQGSSQAYVYYTAMETTSHWFLIYNFFHPRDYSDKCVGGSCHENDNEGLILTVAKDRSRFGRLQVMETLAHNNIYSYLADRRIRKRVHRPDGSIEVYQDSHPVVFVESGGHGVYGSGDKDGKSLYRFDRDAFSVGTGVTYLYKGRAERPQHANDRLVGYDLLSIYEHWWLRAISPANRREHTFDHPFDYKPFGGRPRVKVGMIPQSFWGRKRAKNKAKPFWGWHDNRTKKKKVLATGQWGLDPAYAVSRNLRFPSGEPFSLEYIYNPYLGIDRRR